MAMKRRTFTPHPSHAFDCACGTDGCQDVSHQGRGYNCRRCLRSDYDRETERPCQMTVLATAFDPTNLAKVCEDPKQVVILMRPGDRTPECNKFGTLDLSRLAPAWHSLLLSDAEQAELQSVHLERVSHELISPSRREGYLGQLTSIGYGQCRRAGQQLRQRYPVGNLRACSADSPATIQTAGGVLLAYGLEHPVVHVAADEMLVQKSGCCQRYADLRGSCLEVARKNATGQDLQRQVERMLIPLGKEMMTEIPDFTPYCVHQDVVGPIPGIHWEMAKTIEKYKAFLEAATLSTSKELLHLEAGRLVQEVLDYLAVDGHQLTLLVPHDTIIVAFLVALDIYKEHVALPGSMLLLETTDLVGQRQVRLLVNHEVYLDWQPLESLRWRVSAIAVSSDAK